MGWRDDQRRAERDGCRGKCFHRRRSFLLRFCDQKPQTQERAERAAVCVVVLLLTWNIEDTPTLAGKPVLGSLSVERAGMAPDGLAGLCTKPC